MRKWIDLLSESVSELENRFGNEDQYEIIEYDEDDEESEFDCTVFSDGWATAICTNWALQVKKALPGRVKIMGFTYRNNPVKGVPHFSDGHDFALVDNRYIVDGWLKNVAQASSRAVFDLENPADADDIEHFYGDRSTWTEIDWNG